jgi:hypothetical protein
VTVKGQPRAALVRFGDPVTPIQPGFTADVILALDHPTEPGLHIPNTELPEQWDRADPETHTRMVASVVVRACRTGLWAAGRGTRRREACLHRQRGSRSGRPQAVTL